VRRRHAAASAGVALAVALAGPAFASTQQVLLPGPGPYPTQSPPLAVRGAPAPAFLPFRVTARTDQRVVAGVNGDGRVVSLRVRHRLVLSGSGDYQILIGAPVVDVQAGPGSQSEPGLRTGQILWAGFSPGRKVLVADAQLRPAAATPFLPVRLHARREGHRYSLTVTNATETSEIAFTGAGRSRELAGLLDQTRRQELRGERLASAYATVTGLVHVRRQAAHIAAPLRVEGVLRFPGRPSAAHGGAVRGSTVTFAVTLGDGRPLSTTVEVTGGGVPSLRLVAQPRPVLHRLRPPRGRSWRAATRQKRIPARRLLRRLIDTRMEAVRSDQFQSFLSNPDTRGRNRTFYVYETSSAPSRSPGPAAVTADDSGGLDPLVLALVVVGSLVAAGAAVVAWAHS
jgi:hypothetical protein